jgi:multisubunit Na+/H+ antiporter MnhG subunit
MRDAEPGHAVWMGVRWQPLVVLTAFLGGGLYHLQSSDEGFRIAVQHHAITAVARGLFRIPLVYTRSLLATPETTPIVGAGIAIVAAAWWVSLRARRPAIGQFIEMVVILFMLATVAWLLRFGKDDWGSTQDHLKDWAYYSTLRQAAETRQLPLYSKQAFHLQT